MATLAPAIRRTVGSSRLLQAKVLIPVAIVAFIAVSVVAADYEYAYLTRLAIAGLGNGCAAALTGLGLVLTYRTTGVFNFAYGAIATLVAYIFWTLTVNHGWPIAAAGLFALVLVGPAIGLVTDAAIFRPLQRRQASTTEKLVASLGLTVLLIGLTSAIWGLGSNLSPSPLPYADRPPWKPFGPDYPIGFNILGNLVLLAIIATLLTLVFRYTRLGTEIRAVVDRRQLAELSAVNANRVSAIAWGLSCAFAGIVGVLYANTVTLDPYRTTLLVLNTFVVAIVARLRNLPTALVAGIVLGMAQAMVQAYPGELFPTKIGPNLLAIALVVFLAAYRDLDEIGDSAPSTRGLVTARLGSKRQLTPGRLLWITGIVAAVVSVPALVEGQTMLSAQKIVALSIAFLSIVAITGFSGNISLCQAGFAGLGAFLTGKFATVGLFGIGPMPVLLAMLLAAAIMVPVGIIAGYPSLRRRGLILGLSTLAIGIILDSFIFNNDTYLVGLSTLERPSLFGYEMTGHEASWFWFELAILAVMLFLVRNLRSGRLGRILAAMRDSEQGAIATGISLRKYKLFIFAASAFVASIGGSLFMLTVVAFDPQNYTPLQSLFWFTAVVVAGLSYLSGAVLAAILFVGLDQLFNREGASLFIIGAIALLVPFLPGGIVGTLTRLASGGLIPRSLLERYQQARDAAAEQPVSPADGPEGDAPVASPLARKLLTGSRR